MISVDYVYVHSLCYLCSISRGYGLRTIEYIPTKKGSKKHSKKGVNSMIKIFNRRRIGITWVNADNEFKFIREDIETVQSNIVAAGKYVRDIERANRPLKEGTICEIHNCLYK